MIPQNYKLTLIVLIFLLSIIYAYPNIYGEDPAIIITKNTNITNNNLIAKIKSTLKDHNIKYKSINQKNNNLAIRFFSTETQFNTYELIKNTKENITHISLNILNSESIDFLEKIYAFPMKLGLDLRGGVHLLIKVNTKKHINAIIKSYISSIKTELKANNLKYDYIKIKNTKTIKIKSNTDINKIKSSLNKYIIDLNIHPYKDTKIKININNKKKHEIKTDIIEKTLYILSKRINELGISDSLIQRQGKDKIIIEIPGIQDISRAKNIIGKTATLDFMLVNTNTNIKHALKGKIPKESKIFYTKDNIPILIKNKSILSGDAIIHASAGFESQFNKPCINIKLGAKNIKTFEQITMKNIGKPMAIIYKENIINNKKEESKESIISVATIMSALSNNFQITGLNIQESKDLALLLRSGALPATISIIEEKIIGPGLGEQNIKNGITSISIAFVSILIFMLIYYKKLGIIANIALITNLMLLIAIMSVIGITLTLPGLAGIALTIGMSIDANILIFERIKEEQKKEYNVIYCIEKGFKNAFSSIIDSNLTTLLIGLTLFILGHGPVKGFAITLSIGIITSMYSSIFVTKAITRYLTTKKIYLIKNENKLYKNK